MRSIYCLFAVLSIALLACSARLECAAAKPAATKSFKLVVAATTMTQIVVQWTGEPKNTASYDLERATDSTFAANVKTYTLSKDTFVFSDTDRPALSKTRFTGSTREALLDPQTTYYYRVKATLTNGESRLSNTVNAKVSGPVRGKAGDLWGDIALGQPDLGSNAAYQAAKNCVNHPSGVLLDKTVKPNRMYIVDGNNNRILGFKTTSAKDGADIVLGQPDFSSSSGNGDSCAQLFPYRGKSTAKSLCFTLPDQISMSETVVLVSMAVDDKGNLYVPDIFNNRVLKYDDPFNTDTVADEVWGQADFSGNEENRGKKTGGSNTLSFNGRAATAIDEEGNLWVVDSGNNRVLRFPKNKQTGVIAKDADLVLGQRDMTSVGDAGFKRTLSQLWYPISLGFDAKGNLYVGDGLTQSSDGRLLVYEPPFKSGMAATRQMPMPAPETGLDEQRKQGLTVASIARDSDPNRMWFGNGQNIAWTELVDLRDGKVISSVPCEQGCGMDVDSDGNVYTVNKWGGIYRYPAACFSLPMAQRTRAIEPVLARNNGPSAGSLGGILGITTFKDQLLIASNARILIWNKWNVNKARSGQPADDVYGAKDFTSMAWERYISSPQEDKSGRLWLVLRANGHTLQAFSYPLTRNSQAIKSIPLAGNKPDLLPLKGGGSMSAAWADFLDFAVVGTGDKIWVADRNASRVFRINNVDGLEDPKSGPYVDIVLGQNNLTEQKYHMGGTKCTARSLAWAYNVDISPKGELLIADNGGECGTDQRVVIYDAKRFPDKPDKCLFADDIGDPDRMLGTGGNLNIGGSDSTDPICSPFEVGISQRGTVVAGMNGYSAQRFPLVYLYPDKTIEPQFALGDLTAYPTCCFIDKDGNVYVGDYDWSRVLIYKDPFKNIRY